MPLRLLVTSVVLAALSGFALSYWRTQPPRYTSRAESLFYQTQVVQVLLSGPLRTTLKRPDGSVAERIILPDLQPQTPPSQGHVMSQSGGGPPAASTPPAVKPPKATSVASPPPLPTRPAYAIDSALYKKIKGSVTEWVKNEGVSLGPLPQSKELNDGPVPLSLMFTATTETVTAPDAVGIKLVLQVMRPVLGNRMAREGEKLTIATYHTGTVWVAPADVPARFEELASYLVKQFCDDWKEAQIATDDDMVHETGKKK